MDLFKFPDKCLGFRLELVDEFTEIVPSAFGSSGIVCKCKDIFFIFKSVFMIAKIT